MSDDSAGGDRVFRLERRWRPGEMFERVWPERTITRVVTLYLGGLNAGSATPRLLSDASVRVRTGLEDLSRTANLFVPGPSCECALEVTGEPGRRAAGSYAALLECLEHVPSNSGCQSPFHELCANLVIRHSLTELMPIGAAVHDRMSFGAAVRYGDVDYETRLYVAARLDRDTVYSYAGLGESVLCLADDAPVTVMSRPPGQPPSFAGVAAYQVSSAAEAHASLLVGSMRHGFIEPELDERAHNDLSIMEREIKFDALSDPRAATWKIMPGNGRDIFSGKPILNVHYHRVYNIGPTGIVFMSSDTAGTDGMLKYKQTLISQGDVFLRFEVVEPYSSDNLKRIAELLQPGVDVASATLTPYFFRDRVKCNVYMAESRNVFEVFGDHSTFLDGEYADFNQVEIEYVGVIQDREKPVALGSDFEAAVDADFARVKSLVLQEYAKVGIALEWTVRSKFDWARAEVFLRGQAEEN
jgi:hypothetical protein